MISLITKIFGSKEEKAIAKELSDEQKDIKEMESALKRLKSRKFRIERVEYDHTTDNPKVFYFAQIYGKTKWVDGFTAEYNNNEWWRLYKGRDGNIYIHPYMGGGFACTDEQDALELIENYKREEEEYIKKKPEIRKFLREQEKQMAEIKKERQSEYEKTKPKITHKEL